MKQNKLLILLLSQLLLAFLFSAVCLAAKIEISEDQGRYKLAPSLHYLVDSESKLSFDSVLQADAKGMFVENNKQSLNFGFSEKSYWVRISFSGDLVSKHGWLLELTYAAIDLYEVYIPNNEGAYHVKQTGDSIAFSSWDIPFVNPTILLGQKLPNKHPIYLKVETTGVVNIAPVLWRAPQFFDHVGTSKFGFGIYYGIMLALILYNLFIFIAIRDKNYLLYTAFITAFTMGQLTYNGLGFQFFWPQGNWFANFSYTFFLSFLFIPMILFAKSFLHIKKHLPRTNSLLSGLLFVYIAIPISHFIIGMSLTNTISSISSIFTASIIYYCALYAFLQGERAARFFLLAWTIYIIALVTLLFKMLGIFPHNYFTEYCTQVGGAIEGILLSFALADRINILKEEKAAAQQKTLEQVRESDAIKSQYLEKAELMVKERTRELTHAKDKLVKLTRRDTLTGLYNRMVFNDVYEKVFSQAKRNGSNLSLLIIDVDWFKKYNDRYGHLEGDECLQKISTSMQKHAQRQTDTLARYGGEEFCVIMTDTAAKDGFVIGEKIRKEVESLIIPHEDSSFAKVTVSSGLATLTEDNDIGPIEFFNKADNALYKAKESGRNKTVFVE